MLVHLKYLNIHLNYYDKNPPLYENWQQNFAPPNNKMTISHDHNIFPFFLQPGIGIEPRILINKMSLGIPIAYSYPVNLELDGGQNISETEVAWWNKVRVSSYRLIKTGPSAGIRAGYKYVSLEAAIQPYKIMLSKYTGEDCEGCENTSDIFSSEVRERGQGFKASMVFGKHRIHDPIELRLYYEKNGGSWSSGIEINSSSVIKKF